MMNPLLGASVLSWIPPVWNMEELEYAIRQSATTGFDILEILLPPTMQVDVTGIKKLLKQYDMQVTCALNLPPEAHTPKYPTKAINLIKAALDVTSGLSAGYLGGVLHSGIGVFSGKPRTREEEDTLCEVWTEVAAYAAQRDITIGIEPINRYETYVCTSIAETLSLIRRVNAPNLAVHPDTFHMNIEEADFYHPIIEAGNRIQHIHITESDRGMLGEGNVHWDDLFKALHEINYSGRLVLENFSTSVHGMAEAVSLWRPSKYNADELAQGSLEFLTKMIFKEHNNSDEHHFV